MPYINYLFCEECGFPANLDIDQVGTVQSYINEGRKGAHLENSELIWDYLLYRCPFCGKTYKYTYIDVERRVREHLSSLSVAQAEQLEEVARVQSGQQERLSGQYFVERSERISKRLRDMYKE